MWAKVFFFPGHQQGTQFKLWERKYRQANFVIGVTFFSAEGLTDNYFHTSLNDLFKDGDYYWESTGQLLDGGSYNNWREEHPRLGRDNCAVLGTGNTTSSVVGLWQSTNCYSKYPYICEKEDVTCVPNPPENQ